MAVIDQSRMRNACQLLEQHKDTLGLKKIDKIVVFRGDNIRMPPGNAWQSFKEPSIVMFLLPRRPNPQNAFKQPEPANQQPANQGAAE